MGFLSWLSLDRRKREEEEMDQSVSDAMSSESEVSSGFEEDVSSSFESSGDGVSSSREGSSSDSDSDSSSSSEGDSDPDTSSDEDEDSAQVNQQPGLWYQQWYQNVYHQRQLIQMNEYQRAEAVRLGQSGQ